MGKITAYIKSHPWMVGIIVVVGGVLFFMIASGGGGGSSASTVDSGPSDAQIAAEAQIQAAKIAAQASAAQTQSQLSMAQIGAATQSEQAQLEAAVAQHALDVQQATTLAQVAADRDVNLANISAQQSIANTQTNAQLSAVKNTNKSGIIGGAIKAVGAIASIFSDERLKTNIKLVGMHPLGFGVYEFDYITGAKNQVGYLAQEVLKIYPEAVSIHASGYYRVNYDLLEFERRAA